MTRPSRITRTAKPNGTYAYTLDGQPFIAASRVLYTHATAYRVGTRPTDEPIRMHKTEAAAVKATGERTWVKTQVIVIDAI